MKTKIAAALLFFILILSPSYAAAQTTAAATAPLAAVSFDMSDFPQWARDIRRFEIVTFGSFPFTMFTATFAMDTYRWSQANGMDWSDAGRRYAPWPLKSAGAVSMESREYEMTIGIAAGLSLAIAVADFAIVQIKRHKARQRAESLPAGTAIITKKPWPPAAEESAEDGSTGETNDGGSKIAPGVLAPAPSP